MSNWRNNLWFELQLFITWWWPLIVIPILCIGFGYFIARFLS